MHVPDNVEATFDAMYTNGIRDELHCSMVPVK